MNNPHIDDELAVLENYLDTLQAFLLSSFPNPSSLSQSHPDFSSQPVWVEIPPVHDVSPYSEFHVAFSWGGGHGARSARCHGGGGCGGAAIGRWARRHPWVVGGMCVAAVGVAAWGGYRAHKALRGYMHRRNENRPSPAAVPPPPPRDRVVVVLGGDTPLGLPLIAHLELQGFIVITSVSTPSAIKDIENECLGFVRAVVLDPSNPENVNAFIQGVRTALSHCFEPSAFIASPETHLHIHSVISLLTLPLSIASSFSPSSFTTSNPPNLTAPKPKFDTQPLLTSYIPNHTRTSITPLLTIQALLPFFHTSDSDSDSHSRGAKGKKHVQRSIVVCLPRHTSSSVSTLSSLDEAMSASATSRAIDYLRDDIKTMRSARRRTQSGEVGEGGVGGVGDVRVVTIEVSAAPISTSSSTSMALCAKTRNGQLRKTETKTKADPLVRTILSILGPSHPHAAVFSNSNANNSILLGSCTPLALGRRVFVMIRGCLRGLWRGVRGERVYVNRYFPFGVPYYMAPIMEAFVKTREALALRWRRGRRGGGRGRGRCGECQCAHHQHQHQHPHHDDDGQLQHGDAPPQPSFATHPHPGVVAAGEMQVNPSTHDWVRAGVVDQAQALAQDQFTPLTLSVPADPAPAPAPAPAQAQAPPPPPPPSKLLWLAASKEPKPLPVNPNPNPISSSEDDDDGGEEERNQRGDEGTASPIDSSNGYSVSNSSVSDGSGNGNEARIDASWVSLDE